jgi:hypothetical protein
MNSSTEVTSGSVLRQANYALVAAAAILIVQGLFRTDTSEDLLAYLLVVVAAILPSALWIRAGAPGIPVLPVAALPYVVYFALPLMRGSEAVLEYSALEIFRAGATVSLFLVVATVSSWVLAGRPRPNRSVPLDTVAAPRLTKLILIGLALGAALQATLLSGSLPDVGSFFGLLRGIVFTFTTVACYLLGVARARGLLLGKAWLVAVTLLIVLILLSWSTLFLVAGIMYALTAVMGFVIAGKRVPWAILVVGFIAITVLHVGKAEMRKNYWEQGTNVVSGYSVAQLPQILVEWIGAGMTALISGAEMGDALGRASLIQMLLRVQRVTPDSIEFLEGETYALLPQMLVPRFVDPDKITSQAGMNLLNIHYGIQSERATYTTAVGWGLVPEAFANFGYAGVIGVALIVGILCGALTRWSAGAPTVSLPVLFAIGAMANLINMEADLANLATTMAQSAAAVLLLLGVFKALSGREKNLRTPRVFPVVVPRKRS